MESRPEISLLAPKGSRANTVSTLVLRERSASELVTSLATKGWTIAVGLEDESDREIRIGHMGEVTVGQLSELLAAIDKEL